MNLGLNIKYIVDEKNGVVIAKFEDRYFNLAYYLDEHSSRQKMDFAWADSEIIDLTRLAGKACCSKQDKFDKKLGKVIARKRLMRQLYRRFLRHATDAIEKRYEQIRELTTWAVRFSAKIEHTNSNIDTLMEKLNVR